MDRHPHPRSRVAGHGAKAQGGGSLMEQKFWKFLAVSLGSLRREEEVDLWFLFRALRSLGVMSPLSRLPAGTARASPGSPSPAWTVTLDVTGRLPRAQRGPLRPAQDKLAGPAGPISSGRAPQSHPAPCPSSVPAPQGPRGADLRDTRPPPLPQGTPLQWLDQAAPALLWLPERERPSPLGASCRRVGDHPEGEPGTSGL